MNKVGLYINTIKYLRPSQIFLKFCRCIRTKVIIKSLPDQFRIPHIFLSELDEDIEYLSRFRVDNLLDNHIFLLNENHILCENDWSVEGQPRHLWLFNLQYMEYLIPLSITYKKTKKIKYLEKVYNLLESWLNHYSKIRNDAWQSYTISMRIPNILISLDILRNEFIGHEKLFVKLKMSIYKQYHYLKNNMELHLLGNHYFENLKCLLICSWCFGEVNEIKKYVTMLNAECKEQILADGMHFERSFMYHKIVLEDLLRIVAVLNSSKSTKKFSDYFLEYIKKMSIVEASFESDINRTLLFNDAGNNVAKSSHSLLNVVEKFGIIVDKEKLVNELPIAGYYKYIIRGLSSKSSRQEYAQLVIDCGEIGPRYIPGHGQCDCLSYELFLIGKPLIVNSGTYQYQDELRSYFRSTASHNTFTINGFEQSQCWGEHRVAKRIKNIRGIYKNNQFIGTYSDWNGAVGKRKIQIDQNTIHITDVCINQQDAMLESWLHFAPDWNFQRIDWNQGKLINKKSLYEVKIYIHHMDDLAIIEEQPYAEEFGRIEYIDSIRIKGNKISYDIQLINKE